MSLRLRLTLVVAVTFALVVVGCTYAAHVSASRQLRSETDAFLVQRSTRFTHAAPGEIPARRTGRRRRRRSAAARRSPTPTRSRRSSTRTGRIVASINGQPTLPIDAGDRLARATRRPRCASANIKVERRHVPDAHGRRCPTTARSQIARSIDADNDVLVVARHPAAAHRARRHDRRRVARVADRPPHRAADRGAHAHRDLRRRDPGPRQPDHGRAAATRSAGSRRASTACSTRCARRASSNAGSVLDASHELRTPLTALRTNIDLLRRARSFDQDQRDELLGETDVELRELTDLVSELVELATDTRTEEAVQQIDLGELVERVVTRQQRRTGRDDLARDRPARDRRRAGHAARTRDHEPARQRVEVQPARHRRSRSSCDGADVEILDRGAGIDPDDLPHVFDRFYRSTTARGVPGSGLGLAIVEQIAELHGGTVTLAPRAGGGIRARLDLRRPRRRPAPAPAHDATPSN